jgi:hypothetical protein
LLPISAKISTLHSIRWTDGEAYEIVAFGERNGAYFGVDGVPIDVVEVVCSENMLERCARLQTNV